MYVCIVHPASLYTLTVAAVVTQLVTVAELLDVRCEDKCNNALKEDEEHSHS